MKNKISRLMKTLYNKKKILGVILVIFVMLFTITRTTTYKKFISSINKKEVKDDLELDHWEISTVFYDSTVDNGTTPLTEINWDASDGGYDEGEARIITVQINYKNTNAVRDYDPETLTITLPNLFYGTYYLKRYSDYYRPNGTPYIASPAYDSNILVDSAANAGGFAGV